MCLALIAINQHPLYPLIILSNRDEFYKRATAPAHYWPESPNLFAGQDLEGGGTWLGVNKNSSFALITNYRNPNAYDPLMQSRGLLVKNYLLDSTRILPSVYINKIVPNAMRYNPFNLFVGTINTLVYYSNIENKAKELTPGLYGISNHLLDTPWYKVLRAKELFNKRLGKLRASANPEQIEDLLFPILEDCRLAPDNLLPQTGVPIELEKSLSSIFVTVPNHEYGTRSSTLILFTKENIFFSEKIFIQGEATSLKKTNIKTLI